MAAITRYDYGGGGGGCRRRGLVSAREWNLSRPFYCLLKVSQRFAPGRDIYTRPFGTSDGGRDGAPGADNPGCGALKTSESRPGIMEFILLENGLFFLSCSAVFLAFPEFGPNWLIRSGAKARTVGLLKPIQQLSKLYEKANSSLSCTYGTVGAPLVENVVKWKWGCLENFQFERLKLSRFDIMKNSLAELEL
jgi:hypothetical protein